MKLINEITTEQKDKAFETYRNSQKMGFFLYFVLCFMVFVAWKISTEIISFILQELDIILESLPPWTIGPFDAWRAILSQTRGRSKNQWTI